MTLAWGGREIIRLEASCLQRQQRRTRSSWCRHPRTEVAGPSVFQDFSKSPALLCYVVPLGGDRSDYRDGGRGLEEILNVK
jgi:hypothetical protein